MGPHLKLGEKLGLCRMVGWGQGVDVRTDLIAAVWQLPHGVEVVMSYSTSLSASGVFLKGAIKA